MDDCDNILFWNFILRREKKIASRTFQNRGAGGEFEGEPQIITFFMSMKIADILHNQT